MRALFLLSLLALAPTPAAQHLTDPYQVLEPFEHEQFGEAVAIDGDRMIVGAPSSGNYLTGRAYAYERADDGTWLLTQVLGTIREEDAAENSQRAFGHAIDIAGDLAVIGAPDISRYTGEAFVYRYQNGAWAFVDTLKTDRDADYLGQSVAVSEDGTIVVGGHYLGDEYQGGAIVYTPTGPNSWAGQTLVAPGAEEFEYGGEAVDILGDRLVVGALQTDLGPSRDVGAVYVYERTGSTWSYSARIQPEEYEHQFGRSVGISASGDILIASAANAKMHVFTETDGTWSPSQLFPFGSTYVSGAFTQLDVAGDRAWVGFGGIRLSAQDETFKSAIEFVREPGGWVPARTAALIMDSRPVQLSFDGETLALAASGLQYSERLNVVGIYDLGEPIPPVEISVRETIRVSDGPLLAFPDGSSGVGAWTAFPPRDTLTFAQPVGVTVQLGSVATPGAITASFQSLAPENPDGIPQNATLLPYRWAVEASDSLQFTSASLGFDPDGLVGLGDTTAVTVYRRPNPGQGTFEALPTTFDREAGLIVATGITQFSEFVLVRSGGVANEENVLPETFALSEPFPNPTRTGARLIVSLPAPGAVTVEVFDVQGRRVLRLADRQMAAGQTTVALSTERLAPGAYFVVAERGAERLVSRLTVVR